MKYIITESQLDKVIFRYLNIKDFIKIETDYIIYFVNSENDKNAQIRYNKEDGWCGIHVKLIDEISNFFSLEESDSEKIIGKWVENTIQMKVYHTVERFEISVKNRGYPTNEGDWYFQP
jgi:hypothetical protein